MAADASTASTPLSAGPPAGDARVLADQVRHLYRLSRSAYPGTLVNASIVTFTLWGNVDNRVLLAWYCAVIAITLARFMLYRAYAAASVPGPAAAKWADRFLVGAVAMGSMWGVLGSVLFPVESVPHQFLVIFVIGGMCMSAAVALAPVRRVFYGFVAPAMLPVILVLVMHGDALQLLMGVLGTVFTIVILAFAVEMRDSINAAIGIKLENADLVVQVSAANRQIRQANETLERKVESQARTEEALRQATRKFEALIDASPLGIIVRGTDGRIEKWNPAMERMFGWSAAEATGTMVPWYPPGKREEGDRFRTMILRGETFSDVEAVRLRKDGSLLTVSLSGAPIYDDAGSAIGVIVIVADITVRKRIEMRQDLQAAITELLAGARTVDDAIVKVIQTMCAKQGWVCGARWILDRRENVLRCSEAWGTESPEVTAFLEETRAMLNPWTGNVAGVVRRVWGSGAPVWVDDVLADPNFRRGPAARRAGLRTALAFPVLIAEDFYGVMEFFAPEVWPRDEELMQLAYQLGNQIGQFVARIEAEQNLRTMATHDALTGLPNRAMFGDRLSQALAQAQRYNRNLALLFVDLDGFKTVNDTLGHDAGDILLREIAARLRAGLREGDVIGRMGGDEFVVLVEEFSESAQLAVVAANILEAVTRPVTVRGQACRVTASVGVSAYPRDGRDSQTLMRNADSAMYRAKERGKNQVQFYSA